MAWQKPNWPNASRLRGCASCNPTLFADKRGCGSPVQMRGARSRSMKLKSRRLWKRGLLSGTTLVLALLLRRRQWDAGVDPSCFLLGHPSALTKQTLRTLHFPKPCTPVPLSLIAAKCRPHARRGRRSGPPLPRSSHVIHTKTNMMMCFCSIDN